MARPRKPKSSFYRFNSSPEVIRLVVMMYVKYPLLLRNVEDLLLMLADQLDALVIQIQALERRLLTWHRQDQTSQRLATIPGVGLISATAFAASVPNPRGTILARHF